MIRIIAFVSALLLLPASAIAQNFNPFVYHIFSNNWRGTEYQLDVYQGGTKDNFFGVTLAANKAGQRWRLVYSTDQYFTITTKVFGNTMCLDTVNGGVADNKARMSPCNGASGQRWVVRADPQGGYRLTNLFRGPSMCLDTVNGGSDNNDARVISCSNAAGQIWTIRETFETVQ